MATGSPDIRSRQAMVISAETPYPSQAAGARVRLASFAPHLADHGVELNYRPTLSEREYAIVVSSASSAAKALVVASAAGVNPALGLYVALPATVAVPTVVPALQSVGALAWGPKTLKVILPIGAEPPASFAATAVGAIWLPTAPVAGAAAVRLGRTGLAPRSIA